MQVFSVLARQEDLRHAGILMNRDAQEYRASEARALADIGTLLAEVHLPDVEVRLPGNLAEAAIAAWDRDDLDSASVETVDQRLERHRAGSLALIGLAINERGRWEQNGVIVPLNAGLIATAINAAEESPR